MRIKDIMKPIRVDIRPENGPTVPDITDIYALSSEVYATGRRTVYVTDEGGRCTGSISTETLLYLTANNNLAKLSSILNRIEEAVVAVDREGRIFYANKNYTTILGVPLGKIIGKNLHVIESEAALIQVLETQQPIIKDKTYIKTIDKYVSVRMFPLFTEGEFQGAVSIFKDVTETNRLNNELLRISEEAREYKDQLQANSSIEKLDIVGADPRFQKALSQALVVAKTDATVLIRGENGTGKEVFVKLIQQNSARKDAPFITVNCAAIPENLIESELFGYEDGAFTGAKKGGKIGKFQLADGGTIFLDEIGDMPVAMQAKLLRVLQENEIEKIGKTGNVSIDVRVIAATNQPLEELIEKKLFRRDLYYRINVITLTIPPLRERPHDTVLLINHFLSQFNAKYGRHCTIEQLCYQALLQFDWPGNVRELKSCIEHAVILCTGPTIRVDDLPASVASAQRGAAVPAPAQGDDTPVLPLQECLDRYEGELLAAALRKSRNKTEAMQRLQLSRRTFYRKLSQHGIQ